MNRHERRANERLAVAFMLGAANHHPGVEILDFILVLAVPLFHFRLSLPTGKQALPTLPPELRSMVVEMANSVRDKPWFSASAVPTNRWRPRNSGSNVPSQP